jgi:hypothetical protein
MHKKFSIVSCFLVFILFILFFLDKYVSVHAPKNTALKHYWLLNFKDQKFDMAFIGPSRVLNTLDMSVFQKSGNGNCINLGLSGSAFAEQYLLLDLFLNAHNNQIKKLFIEVSYFNLINPDSSFSYPFHEYYYFPFIKNDNVSKVILDNSKNKLKAYAWKYIPFFRYVEFNSNFRPLVLFKSDYKVGSADVGFDKYGSSLRDERTLNGFLTEKKYTNAFMDSKTIAYLNQMISLAKKKNIEVVLFTAPVYRTKLSYSVTAEANFTDSIMAITNREKLKYYNFETHAVSLDSNNFNDYTHLNILGAKVFSKSFSDTLKSISF